MVASLVLLALVAQQKPLDAQGIYKRALPSVMTLTARDKDSESIGTGFLALHGGFAVTAWHVVKGASKVSARFADGAECEVSGLVAKDEARDIAVIRVNATDRPLLPLAKSDPEVGSKCFIIGAPKGLEFSISEGIISQLRVVKGVKELQHTCQQNPGNSGGPLLDDTGHVLGIIDWHLRDSEGLNFAIASSYAKTFDITRPIESWASVAATATGEEIDNALANGLTSLMDANTALQFLNNELVRKEGGFHQTIPTFYFSIRNDLADEIDTLTNLTTEDRVRRSAKAELAFHLKDVLEAMDWASKAVKAAAANGGWNDEARSTLNNSRAPYGKAFLAMPAVYDFYEKEGDKASLPEVVRMWSGVERDNTGFNIGLCSFIADELQLIEVLPKSFGASLGFKTGDHVEAVNGHRISGLNALKRVIKGSLGTTLTVTIQRDGSLVDLPIALPEQIPTQYAYTAIGG